MRFHIVILVVALGCSLVTCKPSKQDMTNKNHTSGHFNDGVSADNDGDNEYDGINSTTETVNLTNVPKFITNAFEQFSSDFEQMVADLTKGIQNVSDAIHDSDHQSNDAAGAIADTKVDVATKVIDGATKTIDHLLNNVVTDGISESRNDIIDGIQHAAGGGDSFKGYAADYLLDIANGMGNGTDSIVRGIMNIAVHTAADTLAKPLVHGIAKVEPIAEHFIRDFIVPKATTLAKGIEIATKA